MRNILARAVVLVLMVLAVAAFAIDWNVLIGPTDRRGTDDAMLQGNPTQLATRAGGFLAAVPVGDYAFVHAGELLFQVDDRDYRARLDQSAAEVAAAEADVAEGEAELALQVARLGVGAATIQGGQADLERVRLERLRQDSLLHTESFLQRDWQDAVAAEQRQRATVEGDRRALSAAQARLGVLRAELQARRATLAAQRAVLTLARVELGHTRITAPSDGVVTARLARRGEYVSPGRALITLVPLRDVWVVANYREVQLTHVRPGQRALVTVDALPGLRLAGHVDSLEPASQALGSVLPPDRATGNFTKVVQRVPVKIVLDRDAIDRDALDGRPGLAGMLRPGLSAEVRIDTGAVP